MFQSYIGEFAGLGVALCWTISALFFERAAHRIGSLSVNFIRLVLAIFYLSITTYFTRGLFFPTDATFYQWFWLGLSGFFGFFICDVFLFKSFTIIGSRTAALVLSFTPMFTALIGWYFLDERLSKMNIWGISVSLLGILIAISSKELKLSIPIKGFLFALIGMVGQCIGIIFSKKGMGGYDPIASTEIRAIIGFFCFVILITFLQRWTKVRDALFETSAIKSVTIGSVFGPFIGVALSLFAIQHTKTGIAATLMSMVPIFIIWPSAIMFKEKITFAQILGTAISMIGAALFFL